MARYRRGDGDYVDVECADAELERYLVLSLQHRIEQDDRAVCCSPRGEGSPRGFCCGRDHNHADCEFDFDNLVLSSCSWKEKGLQTSGGLSHSRKKSSRATIGVFDRGQERALR